MYPPLDMHAFGGSWKLTLGHRVIAKSSSLGTIWLDPLWEFNPEAIALIREFEGKENL